MVDGVQLSPACMECPVCTPGCSVAAGALPPARREAMRQVESALLGAPDAPTPHQCWHCAQAPCLESCPAGAMSRDATSGLISVDRSRCVGCWMCVLACPLGAVLPSFDGSYAVKCDGCQGRDAPACAGSCRPRDALFEPALQVEAARARRASFAAAGWGWPGPVSYPPPQPDPRRPWQPSPIDLTFRYLIVGGGIAAVRAVESIRAADARGRITLVSDEVRPPYSRVLLSHHIAGLKDERSLALRPAGWVEQMGVEMMVGDGAGRLDVDRRQLVLRSGRELGYDRLLIATGAASVRLPIPGGELEGVVGLRNLSDAVAIQAVVAREAIVVGGGFIGLKAAEALTQLGIRVTIVEKLGQLLPRMLDPSAAEIIRERLEAHGIRVLTGVGIREIEGRGRVDGVVLESGERLPGSLVVVGVGVAPNVSWLRGSPVRVNRGVVVDEQMRTNSPDVWAAGDVAEAYDLLSGTGTVSGLWPVAAAQGRIAGANMAGSVERFTGSIPMNTLDVFGLAVASFGRVRGEDERMDEQSPTRYRKRVYGDGALVGAVLVGDLRDAGRLLAEARSWDVHRREVEGRTR